MILRRSYVFFAISQCSVRFPHFFIGFCSFFVVTFLRVFQSNFIIFCHVFPVKACWRIPRSEMIMNMNICDTPSIMSHLSAMTMPNPVVNYTHVLLHRHCYSIFVFIHKTRFALTSISTTKITTITQRYYLPKYTSVRVLCNVCTC